MKLNKSILEAINKGVTLALDDFEDNNQLSSKQNVIKNAGGKKLWGLYNNFVDLGLPSGTMWCKYNLGCDWDKLNMDPEHTKSKDWYGNYYAWGEIKSKDNYVWETYKFKTENGFYFLITKYNNEDDLIELQLEDDTAYQFDNRMKMPTKEQFEELLKYTSSKWIENYQKIKKLNGRLFTSKINGNELFIPATGCKYKDQINCIRSMCYLWSSSRSAISTNNAWYMSVASNFDTMNRGGRCHGFAVRAVLNKN